ncbi:hypothetical protein [Kaistella palustris]|uniref:hypothetical protein n=1 Tax=Kaistella palustris TaxID=493376 RepID=UPI000480E042|nr:hypothetical protein [Kaistella palustris]
MKNLIFVFLTLLLAGCTSQKKYSDFDYSYARSGGIAPIYENLYIKGNSAHYMFEGQGKKYKKDFKVTAQELSDIQTAISANKFRSIQEDYKKVYDNISTIIKVKHGDNSSVKSDASFIMEKDKPRWENVVAVFRQVIEAHVPASAQNK